MIRYAITQRVRRSAPELFDFIVTHHPENHPRWEAEVVEIRREGVAVTGARGIMVRKDFGKMRDIPFVYLEVVPDRRWRIVTDESNVRFDMTTEMIPQGDETDLQVTIEVTLRGFMRLLQPILARVFQRNSRRILTQLLGVVETQTAA